MRKALPTLEPALSTLRHWSPRKPCPVALLVKIDDRDFSFPVDPATGKVTGGPKAYDFLFNQPFMQVKRFFSIKKIRVEEVMGEIAPVLV